MGLIERGVVHDIDVICPRKRLQASEIDQRVIVREHHDVERFNGRQDRDRGHRVVVLERQHPESAQLREVEPRKSIATRDIEPVDLLERGQAEHGERVVAVGVEMIEDPQLRRVDRGEQWIIDADEGAGFEARERSEGRQTGAALDMKRAVGQGVETGEVRQRGVVLEDEPAIHQRREIQPLEDRVPDDAKPAADRGLDAAGIDQREVVLEDDARADDLDVLQPAEIDEVLGLDVQRAVDAANAAESVDVPCGGDVDAGSRGPEQTDRHIGACHGRSPGPAVIRW